MVTACWDWPLDPETVMLLSPGIAYGAAETVRVEFAEVMEGERKTIVGLSMPVILGFPENTAKLTEPEKKPRDLAVIVDDAVEPPAIVRFCGVAMSANEGGTINTANRTS